ncbi:hypothetical protein [Robbsia andropogonis]|uniref:hypothetical protein n=1 Tax=Robbsia andropogonis TaxID=28092 RepID=UPI0004634CC4|nr:hypothetical protein [Robbsia andropogonis]
MEAPKRRGKKPGSPKTGGRKAGTPNKVTADIKALAQSYGPDAIAKLVYLMEFAENEAVQKSAADSILDRGYGKARQAVEVGGQDGFPQVLVTIVKSQGVSDVDSSVQAEE